MSLRSLQHDAQAHQFGSRVNTGTSTQLFLAGDTSTGADKLCFRMAVGLLFLPGNTLTVNEYETALHSCGYEQRRLVHKLVSNMVQLDTEWATIFRTLVEPLRNNLNKVQKAIGYCTDMLPSHASQPKAKRSRAGQAIFTTL